MSVVVRVEQTREGAIATVEVDEHGVTTKHRVTVTDADLERYATRDVDDLVRRSFEFLLAREPNTSILHAFRITEIERSFPEFHSAIRR